MQLRMMSTLLVMWHAIYPSQQTAAVGTEAVVAAAATAAEAVATEEGAVATAAVAATTAVAARPDPASKKLKNF